jgi:hypothetical protein
MTILNHTFKVFVLDYGNLVTNDNITSSAAIRNHIYQSFGDFYTVIKSKLYCHQSSEKIEIYIPARVKVLKSFLLLIQEG